MSWAATAWAQQQRTGSPTGKVVLLLLADRADEKGNSWPTISRLAQEAECSPQTVRRTIQHLVDLGLVEVSARRRPTGAQSSNAYRLRMDRQASSLVAVEEEPSEFTPPTNLEGGGYQSGRGAPTNLVAHATTNVVGGINHQKEPSPPTPGADVQPVRGTEGGAGKDGVTHVLAALGVHGRGAAELRPAVAAALGNGWTPAALARQLQDDLPAKVHSLPRLLAARLDALPEPPRAPRERPWDCPDCHGSGLMEDPATGFPTGEKCHHLRLADTGS